MSPFFLVHLALNSCPIVSDQRAGCRGQAVRGFVGHTSPWASLSWPTWVCPLCIICLMGTRTQQSLPSCSRRGCERPVGEGVWACIIWNKLWLPFFLGFPAAPAQAGVGGVLQLAKNGKLASWTRTRELMQLSSVGPQLVFCLYFFIFIFNILCVYFIIF